jgi:SAM-dependent methyltransferase
MWHGVIGVTMRYALFRRFWPDGERAAPGDGGAYRNRSKLEVLFGPQFWSEIRGKDIIDFGCGVGAEAIEMAQRGARRVIGIDNRQKVLDMAAQSAEASGLGDRCQSVRTTVGQADVVTSIDGFERYDDPAHVLHPLRLLVAAERPCIYQFRSALVASPRRSSVLRLPLGAPRLRRTSAHPFACRFQNRRRNPLLRSRRRIQSDDPTTVPGAPCCQSIQDRAAGAHAGPAPAPALESLNAGIPDRDRALHAGTRDIDGDVHAVETKVARPQLKRRQLSSTTAVLFNKTTRFLNPSTPFVFGALRRPMARPESLGVHGHTDVRSLARKRISYGQVRSNGDHPTGPHPSNCSMLERQ